MTSRPFSTQVLWSVRHHNLALSKSLGFLVPIAFILGYVVPVSIGYSWGDPVGAFIYGGLVTRLASESVVVPNDLPT